jgi:threonyl-tRNA synthetase
MLVEHYGGAMPAWLAPVQVAVCNVSENQAEYVTEVVQALKKQGFRVEGDLRNEKISYKIREHSVQKLPFILVVGDKEKHAMSVAVRGRGGVDLGVMPQADFANLLSDEVTSRRDRPSA